MQATRFAVAKALLRPTYWVSRIHLPGNNINVL
jgi:hypothetical protein